MENNPQTFHKPRTTVQVADLSPDAVLIFGCWAEEAIYLALPFDPNDGVHEGDLIVKVAYSDRSRDMGLSEDDVRTAVEKLLQPVSEQFLVTRYERKGTRFLAKTNVPRSIVLQYT